MMVLISGKVSIFIKKTFKYNLSNFLKFPLKRYANMWCEVRIIP